MAKRILNSLLIISLFFILTLRSEAAEVKEKEIKGAIMISGAWALYPMVVKWAEEFGKIHPKVRIDVAAGGAGKGMADALASVVDIGNVSRAIYPEEVKKGAWAIPVTKDAVVPSINDKNPFLPEILSRGLKKEALTHIWVDDVSKSWGKVLGIEAPDLVNVYTRSDACGAGETWARYLGAKQEDLSGIGVYGDPGVAQAVRKDSLAVGYNNINFVYDPKTKDQVEGVRVLPIDLNENGIIDKEENFYDTRDDIIQAIASGIYPSPPARDLYFVSCGRPKKAVVIEFIKWVLTDGQKYVSEAGYINLSKEKIEEGLKKLNSD
ncbi:MAG: substrate-binding domain-containing protein [Candidatus Omnitrophica bacterium]|nr:substrate-binding domain-containing protein [Candidatus Omnitrophota bacterium]